MGSNVLRTHTVITVTDNANRSWRLSFKPMSLLTPQSNGTNDVYSWCSMRFSIPIKSLLLARIGHGIEIIYFTTTNIIIKWKYRLFVGNTFPIDGENWFSNFSNSETKKIKSKAKMHGFRYPRFKRSHWTFHMTSSGTIVTVRCDTYAVVHFSHTKKITTQWNESIYRNHDISQISIKLLFQTYLCRLLHRCRTCQKFVRIYRTLCLDARCIPIRSSSHLLFEHNETRIMNMNFGIDKHYFWINFMARFAGDTTNVLWKNTDISSHPLENVCSHCVHENIRFMSRVDVNREKFLCMN